MIIVMESDYDYMDIIGVFHTLDMALAHLKTKNLKPQHYEFQTVVNQTEFSPVENIPYWCAWEKCSIGRGLVTFQKWRKQYCENHYNEAVEASKKQQKIYKIRTVQLELQAKEHAQKRIEFEKKWGIEGSAFADWIAMGLSDEETREKIDYWKEGKFMSGSVGVNLPPYVPLYKNKEDAE